MCTVFDVAKYILNKQGPMTAMKLQKLVYYSQAWSLVWDEAPLFDEEIQAWANGPVVPALYSQHRGEYQVSEATIFHGNSEYLNADQIETVDIVLKHYGEYSGHQLSELTHREAPWKDAREGLDDLVRSSKPISVASIAEYYDSLVGND